MPYKQYNSKGQLHGTCQFKAWAILYDNGEPISIALDDGTVIKIDKNTEITNYKIVFRNDAGKTHREDGPALIYADGHKAWYISGQRHREDGPAFIRSNGNKEWYINGQRHREDGPAFIGTNGDKAWWVNGNRYGYGEEPPKEYLQALVDQGVIKHVDAFKRGSDNVV